MNIVVLVGSYYPNYSAVGVCASNIVRELIARGHNLTVIANKTNYDEEQTIQLNEQIFRVSSKLYDSQLYYNRVGKTWRDRICSVFLRVRRYVSAFVRKENIKRDMLDAYYRQLCEIGTGLKIDMLVPFCFPFEGCLAAAMYRGRHKDVRIIPFMMDRFAASTSLHRTNWNKKYKWNQHIALEDFVFQMSEKILFLQSWKMHLVENHSKYQHKFRLTEHPLLKPLCATECVDFDKDMLNVVYTGALIKSVRNPRFCFSVFRQLLDRRKDVCLHLFALGDCEADMKKLAGDYPRNVFYYGAVNSGKAHAAMLAADYLLSIGNRDITQFASKNFEYISTGKGILHFSKNIEDPVNVLLRKYKHSLIVDEDSTDINKAEENVSEFLIAGRVPQRFLSVAEIYRDALPSTSCDLILSDCAVKARE